MSMYFQTGDPPWYNPWPFYQQPFYQPVYQPQTFIGPIHNEWQCCPVCDGSGVDVRNPIPNTPTPECPTCKGKRIISMQTGQPPTI